MSVLIAAGRSITGLFFVLAGINKVTGYEATLTLMETGGLPGALLPLVIGLEIVAGAVVMIGRGARAVMMSAIALAVFTVATNIVFHRFWELDGVMARLELSLFFKNLVVMAALLMVAGAARVNARVKPAP